MKKIYDSYSFLSLSISACSKNFNSNNNTTEQSELNSNHLSMFLETMTPILVL